jgi:hypothetical protein
MLPSGRTDNVSSPGREYSFTFNNAFFIGLDQNQFGSSMPAYYIVSIHKRAFLSRPVKKKRVYVARTFHVRYDMGFGA